MKYPNRFYVIHAYFADLSFPGWGDIGDGPVATMGDVEQVALEHFAKCPEYLPAGSHNLRVTLVEPGIARAWDDTDVVLEFLYAADVPVADEYLKAAE